MPPEDPLVQAPPSPSTLEFRIGRALDRLAGILDRVEAALPWPQLFWGALGAVLGASFLYESSPAADQVWCLTRRITGNPCPGCGLTRAFCAMARGDVGVAFEAHLAGPLLYSATVYGFVAPAIRRAVPAGGRPPSERRNGLWRRSVTIFWWGVVVLYLAQTVRALVQWLPA